MKLQTPKFRAGKLIPSGKKHSKKNSNGGFSLESSVGDDAPSVAESDVSSVDFGLDDESKCEPREKLQWEFHGLTLWVEFEEHDHDLSRAIDGASHFYGTERIPMPHATAIYGMTHLSVDEALEKLEKVQEEFPDGWPAKMDRPISVKQDLAIEGRPGQVCTIAWAELTLKSNEKHEEAVDKLYEIFEVPEKRSGPWLPHISLAYDNPEDSVLNLSDIISYVAQNPSLMEARRVKAVSLWQTEGRMEQWKCLDRVSFF